MTSYRTSRIGIGLFGVMSLLASSWGFVAGWAGLVTAIHTGRGWRVAAFGLLFALFAAVGADFITRRTAYELVLQGNVLTWKSLFETVTMPASECRMHYIGYGSRLFYIVRNDGRTRSYWVAAFGSGRKVRAYIDGFNQSESAIPHASRAPRPMLSAPPLPVKLPGASARTWFRGFTWVLGAGAAVLGLVLLRPGLLLDGFVIYWALLSLLLFTSWLLLRAFHGRTVLEREAGYTTQGPAGAAWDRLRGRLHPEWAPRYAGMWRMNPSTGLATPPLEEVGRGE